MAEVAAEAREAARRARRAARVAWEAHLEAQAAALGAETVARQEGSPVLGSSARLTRAGALRTEQHAERARRLAEQVEASAGEAEVAQDEGSATARALELGAKAASASRSAVREGRQVLGDGLAALRASRCMPWDDLVSLARTVGRVLPLLEALLECVRREQSDAWVLATYAIQGCDLVVYTSETGTGFMRNYSLWVLAVWRLTEEVEGLRDSAIRAKVRVLPSASWSETRASLSKAERLMSMAEQVAELMVRKARREGEERVALGG